MSRARTRCAAWLEGRGAPAELVAWADDHRDDVGAMWRTCPRAGWLIELGRLGGIPEHRLLVVRAEAAIACAIGATEETRRAARAALDRYVASRTDAVELEARIAECASEARARIEAALAQMGAPRADAVRSTLAATVERRALATARRHLGPVVRGASRESRADTCPVPGDRQAG